MLWLTLDILLDVKIREGIDNYYFISLSHFSLRVSSSETPYNNNNEKVKNVQFTTKTHTL